MSNLEQNLILEKISKGQTAIGTWVRTFRTPFIAQALSIAGFDFMYIDMEHGCYNMETVAHMCFAALKSGITPVVRPSSNDPCMMTRPLDNGAMGLIVPHVDTKEEAEAVIEAVRFRPLGNRGMSLQGVHTGFAKAVGDEYTAWANSNQIIIVQIESKKGIENIDSILSVEGINGAVIGRSDLSHDLGYPGQKNHPEVIRRVEYLIEACNYHDVYPGLLVDSTSSANEWISKGIKIMPISNDVSILIKEGSRMVKEIKM